MSKVTKPKAGVKHIKHPKKILIELPKYTIWTGIPHEQ